MYQLITCWFQDKHIHIISKLQDKYYICMQYLQLIQPFTFCFYLVKRAINSLKRLRPKATCLMNLATLRLNLFSISPSLSEIIGILLFSYIIRTRSLTTDLKSRIKISTQAPSRILLFFTIRSHSKTESKHKVKHKVRQ